MSGMAEVLAAHQRDHGKRTLHEHCSCGWAGRVMGGDFTAHQAVMLTAAGFGPVKEAAAKALEDAADAWREYLPAVAGYGKVQPVPVWLERRAEWIKR